MSNLWSANHHDNAIQTKLDQCTNWQQAQSKHPIEDHRRLSEYVLPKYENIKLIISIPLLEFLPSRPEVA
jgi:hypothetical protein